MPKQRLRGVQANVSLLGPRTQGMSKAVPPKFWETRLLSDWLDVVLQQSIRPIGALAFGVGRGQDNPRPASTVSSSATPSVEPIRLQAEEHGGTYYVALSGRLRRSLLTHNDRASRYLLETL